MVNMILAIILAGAVGFFAGHFFTVGNSAPPMSVKEAVTGEEEMAPPVPSLPRPLTTSSTPKSKDRGNAQPLCQPGMTLSEQIARLKLSELTKLCADAETDWQKLNIDSFAPLPKAGPETDQARHEMRQILRDPLMTESHWRGETVLRQGHATIQVDIHIRWYNDERTNEMCYALSPYFTVNGQLSSPSSTSACGGALRKRGDTYYVQWNTFRDADLNPTLNALMIPIPGSRQTALEYLSSQSGQWLSQGDFRWQASSAGEFNDLRERALKKLEGRAR